MLFSVEPELEHRGGHAAVRSGADLSQHRRGGADPLQPRLRRCRLSLSDWRGKSPYVFLSFASKSLRIHETFYNSTDKPLF